MPRNLKKFVNPAFTRTVPLEPMKRLLERHRAGLDGFDFSAFDGEPDEARDAVQDFFAGSADRYPESLVGDLHRIADLGDAAGLSLIVEQSRRLRVDLITPRMRGRPEQQEPKHVALTVFLDHPDVFDAASDMLAFRFSGCTEYDGLEEGVEPVVDEHTQAAFERGASEIFEQELLGCFCRAGWYDDDGDVNLVVTYGKPYATTQVIDAGAVNALCYRAAANAALSYSAADGRLKIQGIPRARRADLAELFATHVLGRPGFFAVPGSQQLYTLEAVERAWPQFQFRHLHDPTIRYVEIVEAQVDRLAPVLVERSRVIEWSLVARDRHKCALERLHADCPSVEFRSGTWRLSHLVLRVGIVATGPKPTKVTVKVKPAAQAIFKRDRFEAQIMELLRRNGFCRDRDADRTAVAAE